MLNHAIEILKEKKIGTQKTHIHKNFENWIKLVSTYLFKHKKDSLRKRGFPG